MPKATIIAALIALAGCAPTLDEARLDVKASPVFETCYMARTGYFLTPHHVGAGGQIDRNTLKAVRERINARHIDCTEFAGEIAMTRQQQIATEAVNAEKAAALGAAAAAAIEASQPPPRLRTTCVNYGYIVNCN